MKATENEKAPNRPTEENAVAANGGLGGVGVANGGADSVNAASGGLETVDAASGRPKAGEAANGGADGVSATNDGQGTSRTVNARDEAERTWRELYEPVERAIVEEHERRVAGRARRRGERAKEKRRARGDLLEATEGFSAVWEQEEWDLGKMVAWADGDSWILACLARAVRMEATRRIDRLRHAERRPMYYEAENARRRALAAERRKVRRRATTNPRPTREQVLDGWLHRSDSHEATIRFGSLIMDLECHLDSSLVRDDSGAIVGRRGGVKRWLQENVPALYLRYTTVMRFKAAAQKLRQVAGLRDPVPAAAIVEPPSTAEEPAAARLRCGRNSGSGASADPEAATGARLPCGRNRMARAAGGGEETASTGLQGGYVAHGREATDAGLRRGRNCAVNMAEDGGEKAGIGLPSGRNSVNGASADPAGAATGARLPCGRNRMARAAGGGEETASTGLQGGYVAHGREAADAGLRRGRNSIDHARETWQEVVAGIGSSPTALMARIDALLDPRRTAEENGMLAGWRRRRASEITVRTKSHGGKTPKWPQRADPESSHRIA